MAFNGLEYIASYTDLMAAFGPNKAAGEFHYNNFGQFEGRTVTFDALEYIASYADLRAAFGANEDAGASHFIVSGRFENRVSTFDGLQYVASHGDLIGAFGANRDAGSAHYIANGVGEGRDTDSFSAYHYLNRHADLKAAFGNNVEAATQHYIEHGAGEGRVDTADLLWAGGLRIMPLGDSITRGTGSVGTGGYRGPLDNLFNTAGQDVDLVGDFVAGSIPDRNHQGISGLTAAQLGTTIAGDIAQHDPDVVLLMIGTNDIINAGATADLTARLIVGVVNTIQATDPTTHVLVGELLPTTRVASGIIASANAQLAAAIDALESQGRPVSFVDTSTITLADIPDGVHPNLTGHTKLANLWFDTIQDEVPHPSGDFIV